MLKCRTIYWSSTMLRHGTSFKTETSFVRRSMITTGWSLHLIVPTSFKTWTSWLNRFRRTLNCSASLGSRMSFKIKRKWRLWSCIAWSWACNRAMWSWTSIPSVRACWYWREAWCWAHEESARSFSVHSVRFASSHEWSPNWGINSLSKSLKRETLSFQI